MFGFKVLRFDLGPRREAGIVSSQSDNLTPGVFVVLSPCLCYVYYDGFVYSSVFFVMVLFCGGVW